MLGTRIKKSKNDGITDKVFSLLPLKNGDSVLLTGTDLGRAVRIFAVKGCYVDVTSSFAADRAMDFPRVGKAAPFTDCDGLYDYVVFINSYLPEYNEKAHSLLDEGGRLIIFNRSADPGFTAPDGQFAREILITDGFTFYSGKK
ncbi:MAG TPA: hypothetical protein IAC70_06950 [Candidatus Faecicola pullistercoris]|nr:hypothetical protein [Candidatus Faecicola pullistercoris]